ncbi:MAG: branched-chain amino acid ABC transporter permease [Nitrospinota bacterium]
MDVVVTGRMLTQALVSGLLMGAVYALIALGLTMTFGVMRVINVAHGESLMLGAFTTYFLFATLGLSPLAGLLLAPPLMFLLGVAIQKVILERVVERIETSSFIVTFGISLVLVNLAIYHWTTDFKAISYLTGSWELGGIAFPLPRLVSSALALAITGGAFAFLKWSWLGKAIRATAQSHEVAQVCGVNIRQIYLLTFGLASALAAAAGVLVSLMFSIYPEMGPTYLLKCFAVVVLGGMGNFLGAFLGALILGSVESIGTLYLGSEAGAAISFSVLVLVLLVRPSGLLGVARE